MIGPCSLCTVFDWLLMYGRHASSICITFGLLHRYGVCLKRKKARILPKQNVLSNTGMIVMIQGTHNLTLSICLSSHVDHILQGLTSADSLHALCSWCTFWSAKCMSHINQPSISCVLLYKHMHSLCCLCYGKSVIPVFFFIVSLPNYSCFV